MRKIFFFIPLFLIFVSCVPYIRVASNIPIWANQLSFINHLDEIVYIYIDGKLMGSVPPQGIRTWSLWLGSGPYNSWGVQVSVIVLDSKNRSWSEVLYLSSYYKLSFVFAIREDEGKLYVDRKN